MSFLTPDVRGHVESFEGIPKIGRAECLSKGTRVLIRRRPHAEELLFASRKPRWANTTRGVVHIAAEQLRKKDGVDQIAFRRAQSAPLCDSSPTKVQACTRQEHKSENDHAPCGSCWDGVARRRHEWEHFVHGM